MVKRSRKKFSLGHSPKPPIFLEFRSSRYLLMFTVCMAVYTDIFLYAVIIPPLPFILEERAGIAPEKVQYWTSVLLTIYAAAVLVASPICGWLADHTSSRQKPFLIGLFALTAANAMLCLGSSIWVLVVGRILAGLSAAIVYTSGVALLIDTVGHEGIGTAMGWVGLSTCMGFVTGPLLGGLIFDAAGVWGIFGITMGMLAWDFVLRILLIEKRFAKEWDEDRRQDEERLISPRFGGANTPHGTVGYDSTQTNDHSQKWPVKAIPASFVLLKNPRLLAALYGMFVQTALVVSFDTVFPLFAKQTFGWSSSGAGFLFLMLFLPALYSPLVGRCSDRWGPKWIAIAAFAISAPPLVLLRLVTDGSMEHVVLMCSLLVLIGFASCSIGPPLMGDVTWVVNNMEKNRPGIFGASGAFAQACGLLNSAVAAGALVGPVWAGFFQEKLGWKATTLSLALLMLSAVVPVMLFTGGKLAVRKPVWWKRITRGVRNGVANEGES